MITVFTILGTRHYLLDYPNLHDTYNELYTYPRYEKYNKYTLLVLSLVNVSYHLINVFYNDEIDAVELRMMLYYKSYGAH